MPEYIERDIFINNELIPLAKQQQKKGVLMAIQKLNEAPTADVVKVVRCKDCEHSRPLCHTEKKIYNDDCVGCTKISTSYHSVIMNENDFCSYGELKEREG